MDDDELKMPSRAKKGSKSMRIRYSLRGLKRKSKTGKKILNQPKRPFFICVRTVGTGGSGNDVINLEQDSTHVSHSPLEHTSPCTSYNAIPNGIPNQKKKTKNKQNRTPRPSSPSTSSPSSHVFILPAHSFTLLSYQTAFSTCYPGNLRVIVLLRQVCCTLRHLSAVIRASLCMLSSAPSRICLPNVSISAHLHTLYRLFFQTLAALLYSSTVPLQLLSIYLRD